MFFCDSDRDIRFSDDEKSKPIKILWTNKGIELHNVCVNRDYSSMYIEFNVEVIDNPRGNDE